jgi:hypothetical protein
MALLSVSSADAQAPANPKQQPKVAVPMGDPPATQAILGNLRAWFKKYANEDGEWDKECVARAFGYRHAYDWVPPAKESSKSEADKEKEDAKKEKDAEKDPDSMLNKPSGPKLDPRYSKRRDFRFLAALDKDGDEKISKDEFEEWAYDYARELAGKYDLLAKAGQLANQAARLQQMQNSLQNRMAQQPPNQRYQAPNQQQPRPGNQQAQASKPPPPKPPAKPAPPKKK